MLRLPQGNDIGRVCWRKKKKRCYDFKEGGKIQQGYADARKSIKEKKKWVVLDKDNKKRKREIEERLKHLIIVVITSKNKTNRSKDNYGKDRIKHKHIKGKRKTASTLSNFRKE